MTDLIEYKTILQDYKPTVPYRMVLKAAQTNIYSSSVQAEKDHSYLNLHSLDLAISITTALRAGLILFNSTMSYHQKAGHFVRG